MKAYQQICVKSAEILRNKLEEFYASGIKFNSVYVSDRFFKPDLLKRIRLLEWKMTEVQRLNDIIGTNEFKVNIQADEIKILSELMKQYEKIK